MVYHVFLYIRMPVIYESFWMPVVGGLLIGTYGMLVALILVLVYGLPLFLILRKFNLASYISVFLIAVTPWAIAFLLLEYMPDQFIEYSWYSLTSAYAFWFFAKKTVNNVQIAT